MRAEIIKKEVSKFTYTESSTATDVARDIKKGCRIIGLTRGQFSLVDLIYSTLTHITGAANVIVVTWSAGIKDVRTVEWMRTTSLIKSLMLITDYSYITRQEKYTIEVEKLFGKENIRTTDIHAKFVLIYNDEWHIAITTSMNLNANKTCEHYEIDEGEGIFNFFEKFVIEVCGAMPNGFTESSVFVNRRLDAIFNNLKDKHSWIKKSRFKNE